MISFTDIAVVLGMMFVRVGIPALVIGALAYGLKQLDKRWEAEARAEQAKHVDEEVQPTMPIAPVRRPSKQPTPQPLPFVPPPAVNKEQRPGVYAQAGVAAPAGLSAASKHCWDEKGCSDSKKASCAAPNHPDQPCWQARFNAEGHVPDECVGCDIFQHLPTM